MILKGYRTAFFDFLLMIDFNDAKGLGAREAVLEFGHFGYN